MIFFSKKGTRPFRREDFREASGNVMNPGRGWYRIYTYVLDEKTDSLFPPTLYDGETLALVLIDIGAYKEKSLTEECLAMLDGILNGFAEGGREMILRVVYDTEGKGMEHEPALFTQVQRHMEQLADLLIKYSRHILLCQGLLVGSWGEMHSSKFVSEKHLLQLAEDFLYLTEGKVRLAVRKPVQYRLMQPSESAAERRIGCFDDAIFASGTHLGTFGTQERREAGWKNPWCMEEEVAFLEQLSESVPFGGEALCGEKGLTAEETVKRLGMLHVSYLNCVHEAGRLQEWQGMSISGISLYDYIGAHMGYRFVVEKAVCERKGKETCLTVKIANRGFACCGEKIQFLLCLRQGGEERSIPVDCGLGTLGGGKSMALHIPLGEEMQRGGISLYGALRRVRDQGRIVFANEHAGGQLLLGRFD